jgi:hypothetical protein
MEAKLFTGPFASLPASGMRLMAVAFVDALAQNN